MISALCTGRLVTNPVAGTTKTEKPFIRATIACDVGGESDVMVGIFVMEPDSINALGRAKKGDSIAAQGNLSPNSYTSKDGTVKHGFSLAFARVMTAQSPKREKAPKTSDPAQFRAAAHAQRSGDDLGDDVPW